MSEKAEGSGEISVRSGTIVINSLSKTMQMGQWQVSLSCSITPNAGTALVTSGPNQKPRVEYLNSSGGLIGSVYDLTLSSGNWVDTNRTLTADPSQARVTANFVLTQPTATVTGNF
jgi:hypothetical protein